MRSPQSRVPSPESRRSLNGLLLLDKPAGMSSNHALQQAKRLFRAQKAGHTGSLDPLATGLLPICFGEATKIAGILLGKTKAYETLACLGATTDTDDADGATLRERLVPAIDDATLEAALAPLRGHIHQRAPIYAALKQGGEPLYVKARRGEAVDAPVREVDVHALDCIERGADWLRLRVTCGSGTYVRSLVRDLGEALGCGAHVVELRRLWVDPFTHPRMHTMAQLQALTGEGLANLDACLLPLEAGLAGLVSIRVDAEQARRLAQGQAIAHTSGASTMPASLVAILAEDGHALGLGLLDGAGTLRTQRLFVRPMTDDDPWRSS
ncbi:MAG: tRNA pseudouridine(55) synthase TruB [Proteobacteria bacterium]|nr:tRNA pseudouridine(55) synthase TruB [Pseudomonadota bacterium]